MVNYIVFFSIILKINLLLYIFEFDLLNPNNRLWQQSERYGHGHVAGEHATPRRY